MTETAHRAPLRITCDTNVVIDALDATRPPAVEIFALVRTDEIDAAFSTRLEHELQKGRTIDHVRALIARAQRQSRQS